MKKSFMLLLVVALMVVTVSAFAAGAKATKPLKPLAPVVSGTVVSVAADGGTVKSFVIRHHRQQLTLTVTADTKIRNGKTTTTAADLKAGQKVLVRLTATVKDNAGTAVIVHIKSATTARTPKSKAK